MRQPVLFTAILALASCASAGTAEDFQWTVDCPRSVDRGAEFTFAVHAVRPGGMEMAGVPYRYLILWAAGSGNPLRHQGSSGKPVEVHARMGAGTAKIVITGVSRDGQDVKLAETSVEVK